MSGDAVILRSISDGSIDNSYPATVTPSTPDAAPVIINCSEGSATESSVTDKPANAVHPLVGDNAALWVCPAGIDTVTGEEGAVKSTPPPDADTGDPSTAVTSISTADPKSLLVAVANAARTRTAGVSPSAKSASTPLVLTSVSAVRVIPRSSSVIDNSVPSNAKPPTPLLRSIFSVPSAMLSAVIVKPVNAAAELETEPAGIVTVTPGSGALKSASSALSPLK